MKAFKKLDGFTPVSKGYPTPFDIVTIADAEGNAQKAWWTGHGWDARIIKINEPVAWKRMH